jgi:hypothetical protein
MKDQLDYSHDYSSLDHGYHPNCKVDRRKANLVEHVKAIFGVANSRAQLLTLSSVFLLSVRFLFTQECFVVLWFSFWF